MTLTREPPLQQIIYDLWIRLSLRSLHDLSDKEAEKLFVAAAICRDLILIRFDDFVNDFLDRSLVRDLFESLFFYYLCRAVAGRERG